ncbi:MAG: TFIIB-type zinc ribbon-containing protein [Candidatus Aenigmatarchaeota archaeon]
MKACPECGSDNLKHDFEGLVCEKCGIVIEESIISGKRII